MEEQKTVKKEANVPVKIRARKSEWVIPFNKGFRQPADVERR